MDLYDFRPHPVPHPCQSPFYSLIAQTTAIPLLLAQTQINSLETEQPSVPVVVTMLVMSSVPMDLEVG